MKTLRIGIATLEQYRDRTIAIAKGRHKPRRGEPRIWFTSLESFGRLLSPNNRALLRLIAQTHPDSIQELADKTGQAKSHLTHILKMMENCCLVQFEDGHDRNWAPRVNYTALSLNMPLQ